MSDNLDERLRKSDNTRVVYKIPNIIASIIAFTRIYEEYCHTSLPLIEIMDKVGEKLGIGHPFTGKLSDYLLEEPILQEIGHMSEIQKEMLLMVAKGYVLSVIKDYNKGKCIEKGKQMILSKYLYKFIKSEISKAPEGLFYRIIS
jgi:hypothetical protein